MDRFLIYSRGRRALIITVTGCVREAFGSIVLSVFGLQIKCQYGGFLYRWARSFSTAIMGLKVF